MSDVRLALGPDKNRTSRHRRLALVQTEPMLVEPASGHFWGRFGARGGQPHTGYSGVLVAVPQSLSGSEIVCSALTMLEY
jgi:hypothetical protein